MDKKLKDKWTARLRSGQYFQGRGAFRNLENEFCCLGVLCDIVNPVGWRVGIDRWYFWKDQKGEFDTTQLDALGLSNEDQTSLIRMNDDERADFNQIADWIDANF